MLLKSTYLVAVEPVVNSKQREPQSRLLDTGAGLKLVRKASLRRKWPKNIDKNKLRHLPTATEAPILLDGTILLFIRTSYLIHLVWLRIVENLVTDILFSTSFIHRYIRRIFLSERKFALRQSSPVSIPSRNISAAVEHDKVERGWKEIFEATIHIAQQTVLPPHTRICIPVNSLATTLIWLDRISLSLDFTLLHVASSVTKPKETQACLDFISNFSAELQRLPDHMILAPSVAPSPFIVGIRNDENIVRKPLNVTDSAKDTSHRKPWEIRAPNATIWNSRAITVTTSL